MERILELEGNGAVYVRVSTDDQDTERQYESTKHFLRKYGVKVHNEFWFEDKGYARDQTDRPEFQRMLRAVERGEIQWILVDQQDRFGTKTAKQFLHFLYVLEEAQCRLVTVDGKDLTADDLPALLDAMLESDRSTKEPRQKSWRILNRLIVLARRGIHIGGLPPFAFDVGIFATEFDTTELWRVVYVGKLKRLKVYPDGRTECFDGKGNFPPREKDQVRRLVPSHDEKKLAAARLVFHTHATQVISFNKLAGILNSMGYRAGGGRLFNANHIQAMLWQPAYIGYPAWNRRHVGKYHVWRNGEATKVTPKEKRFQNNKQEDWIISEKTWYTPVVDSSDWEDTQEKLIGRNPRQRESRSSDFLLSGILICTNCGKPMAGGQRKHRNGDYVPEYYCSTYHQYVSGGRKDESPCFRNTVKQIEILALLREYCADVREQLEAIKQVQSSGNPELLEPYRQRQIEMFHKCVDLTAQMQKVVLEQGMEIAVQPGESFVGKIQEAYGSLFETSQPDLLARISRLEMEHDELTERVLTLPPDLKRVHQKAQQRLAELEAELDRSERQLENASEAMEKNQILLAEATRAFGSAKESLANETDMSACREQAAAIRSVVQSVGLEFVPVSQDDERKTGQVRKRASKIVRATIVSALGKELTVERGCDSSMVTSARNHGRD